VNAIRIISNNGLDIHCALDIEDWQSEPCYQHQNPAQSWTKTIKRMTNAIMDSTGSPPHTWLL